MSHAAHSIQRDPLFQPFRLKGLTLKNRVMSTSHAAGLEEGGMPKVRYQLYHEEKAKGGIGLTMFGGSSNVAPDSPNIFRQLNMGTDDIIPWLRQFSDRIHGYGAALMIQITHLGRRGEPYADNFLPTIAPSMMRETLHRSFPKEMDRHDIARVTNAYGEAARRAKEGGLDGLEALAVGQFLSPSTNVRADGYGGSLENRCRFALETFEAIRKQVGDDYVVGLRYVIDEGETGLTRSDALKAAHIFERSGLIDFFNAIYGRMDTERALAVENMPGMASPIAPWLAQVGRFKTEVGLPVFHAARISDIATARHAIREGLLDLVAMTRAHIAAPHIMAKIGGGQEDRTRPCVGATHCQAPSRPACLHNPSTGREATLPHAIDRAGAARRIVVVGAGPAGLEAARVSAERGHQVTLFEAADKAGGQLLLGARASWRGDILGLVDWRMAELRRLGVRMEFGHYAEASDVTSEEPDAVVIATGGAPDFGWIEGAEHCLSVWDVIAGAAPLADEVIVYDGTGRQPAPQAAELALQAGKRTHFVSLDAQVAQELTYAERVIWKKRMYELGALTLFDHEIVRVEKRGNRVLATFRNLTTEALVERSADQCLIEYGVRPVDDLYQTLRAASGNDGVTDIDALIAGRRQPFEGAFELHRIGDCVSSRNVHAAVYDALRLCGVM